VSYPDIIAESISNIMAVLDAHVTFRRTTTLGHLNQRLIGLLCMQEVVKYSIISTPSPENIICASTAEHGTK